MPWSWSWEALLPQNWAKKKGKMQRGFAGIWAEVGDSGETAWALQEAGGARSYRMNPVSEHWVLGYQEKAEPLPV